MLVSVIIATKNEEENISNCLKSVSRQSQKCEIVVVDNFSEDKTVVIVRKFTKKVFTKGPERSTQRNFGLKKAKGEFVLFLDADMILEKNVVLECITSFKKNSYLSGIIIDEVPKGKGLLARIKKLEKRLNTGHPNLEAARFFKLKEVIKVGGYDEKLFAGEDWDLSKKMEMLGALARIESKIYHIENETFWDDIKKKYYYSKNIRVYAKKHPHSFKTQAGIVRLSIIFSQPSLIVKHPMEFIGLLFLKSFHYSAFLIASVRSND